jgi:transglutaminase-like putative cysteine protease
LVTTTQLGFTLERMPYEVAFENWRNDTTHLAVEDDRDILETTAIAANKRMDRRVETLKVRLTGVDLTGFDLNGERQRLDGDVLTIEPLATNAMDASWRLPGKAPVDPKYLAAEPLIQSKNDDIFLLAYKIQNFQHDPRTVAAQLNRWVHDSISARVTFGIPSALDVLEKRVGDCNEHTQLYVAMARAIGLPARVAAGLAYVDGKFYYHAWPEVFLGDWVGVDPTFGQFPADAAHLRFTIGGLERQTSLLRLMGNLEIDVLDVNGAQPAPTRRR